MVILGGWAFLIGEVPLYSEQLGAQAGTCCCHGADERRVPIRRVEYSVVLAGFVQQVEACRAERFDSCLRYALGVSV